MLDCQDIRDAITLLERHVAKDSAAITHLQGALQWLGEAAQPPTKKPKLTIRTAIITVLDGIGTPVDQATLRREVVRQLRAPVSRSSLQAALRRETHRHDPEVWRIGQDSWTSFAPEKALDRAYALQAKARDH